MYKYQARVERWIDGDTVVLLIDLGFYLNTVQTFRLNGVDTPERGKPGFTDAVHRVLELAPPNSWVEVTTYKADKYGRWLVDIIVYQPKVGQYATVSQILIAEGLAKEYHGGTKA